MRHTGSSWTRAQKANLPTAQRRTSKKSHRPYKSYSFPHPCPTNRLPVEMLTEFVLKVNHGRNLFEVARGLEALAFSRQFRSPNNVHSDYRGVIGAVLDFLQLNRKTYFQASKDDNSAQPTQVAGTDANTGPIHDQPELPIAQ